MDENSHPVPEGCRSKQKRGTMDYYVFLSTIVYYGPTSTAIKKNQWKGFDVQKWDSGKKKQKHTRLDWHQIRWITF